MITRLRKDLGNEKIPVIVGELGRFASTYQNGKFKYTDIVNKALKTMPSTIENCGFASSKDLTDRGDGIHFNSVSYRIFGKRYFSEYLKVIGAEKSNVFSNNVTTVLLTVIVSIFCGFLFPMKNRIQIF